MNPAEASRRAAYFAHEKALALSLEETLPAHATTHFTVAPCQEIHVMKRSILALLLPCILAASIDDSVFAAGPHLTVRLTKPGQFVPPAVRCLRFSPDGTRLAVSHSRGTTVIRTRDGEVTAEARLTPETLAWSRDGSKLLFVSHKERWLIDSEEGTGEPVATREERGFIGLRLEQRNGKLLIVEIAPGSPLASVDGIHVGDELIAIGPGRAGYMHSVIGK